jgi:hypothetical protein
MYWAKIRITCGIVSVGTKAFDKNVSGNIISIAYIDAEDTDFAVIATKANSQLKHQPTNPKGFQGYE